MNDCFLRIAAAVRNVILKGFYRCGSQKVWLWLPDMLEEFDEAFWGQDLVTNDLHSTLMLLANHMVGSLTSRGFLFAVWS